MALKPFARIPLTRSAASSASSASSAGSGRAESASAGFGRICTVRISFAGLLAGGIILLIALGWMFAFGVIVGRGYDPEEKLPKLASLLPKQENGQDRNNGRDGEAEEPAILKAEELTFMRDLRLPGTGEAAPPAHTPAPAPAAPSVPAGPAAPAAPPAPGSEQARKPAAGKYDFVFQVAAFKNSSQSDTLRERLEDEGLRTRMTIDKDNKGKPRWYRVQVILRGTEADAEAVMGILQKVRLRDARVVSKTAAGKSR